MSFSSRFILSLLVVLFTFNQVVLAHTISKHSKVALCDPMELDAEEKSIEEALELTDVASRSMMLMAFVPFYFDFIADETTTVDVPHCTSPHSLHVPIYLDDCVLVV